VTTTGGTTAAIVTMRTTIAKMKRERFDLRHLRLLTCFSVSDILGYRGKVKEEKGIESGFVKTLPIHKAIDSYSSGQLIINGSDRVAPVQRVSALALKWREGGPRPDAERVLDET
jgi:hypothetical protein